VTRRREAFVLPPGASVVTVTKGGSVTKAKTRKLWAARRTALAKYLSIPERMDEKRLKIDYAGAGGFGTAMFGEDFQPIYEEEDGNEDEPYGVMTSAEASKVPGPETGVKADPMGPRASSVEWRQERMRRYLAEWDTVARRILQREAQPDLTFGQHPDSYDRLVRSHLRWNIGDGDFLTAYNAFASGWVHVVATYGLGRVYLESSSGQKRAVKLLTSMLYPPMFKDIVAGQVALEDIRRVDDLWNVVYSARALYVQACAARKSDKNDGGHSTGQHKDFGRGN
jgi:hypothetical protein